MVEVPLVEQRNEVHRRTRSRGRRRSLRLQVRVPLDRVHKDLPIAHGVPGRPLLDCHTHTMCHNAVFGDGL